MFNHHLIKRCLASGLVIVAATVPAGTAQAFHIEQSGGGPVPVAPPVSHLAPSQPVASSGSSFQWGDAGIGAGGAAVLMGTAALGASATRRRRRTVLS